MTIKCILGGILMGLANLVPGISGGTMLLAVGIYDAVVRSIADLAAMRHAWRNLLLLALVVIPGVLAVVLLSGVAGRLVLEHRWIAYSVFIGLTLGGVPVLLRSIGRCSPATILGLIFGLVVMVVLVTSDSGGTAASGGSGPGVLFIAGVLAGASMLLPGLSGSYILLLLGQYVIVLAAIDEGRTAFTAGDWSNLLASFWTILPVAAGVVLGIFLVGIIVRWLLMRFRAITLGVLLGLLLGAVLGLWPFRVPVPPEVGDVIRGTEITSEEAALAVKPKYWRTEGFTPSAGELGTAGALILAGALVSGAIGLLGGVQEERSSSPART